MQSPHWATAKQMVAAARASGSETTWLARHANLIALALLCCAGAYRVMLILHGWPSFDDDQAIIGLMARHIWLNGEHPLFFYGQQYMGPVEAYAAVPFFAFFGSSILTLRLAMLPLILLFLALMYVLGRITYGPVVGLLVLAWLTVGPSIAVYRDVVTMGGKQEMLVLSGVILVCAWARLRLPERMPRNWRDWLRCVGIYAVLGAACGLGVWSDWLIMPLVLLTILALLLVRPREVLSWAGGALALGFLVGAWPFIQFNVVNHFASIAQAVHFSGNGDSSPISHLTALPSLVGTSAAIDVPAIFGSPHVCVQTSGNLGVYWIAQLGPAGGLCSQVNALLSCVILVLAVLVAWPLAQAIPVSWLAFRQRMPQLPRRILLSPTGALIMWRRLETPVSPAEARHMARLWLRGILLINALLLLFAFVNNPLTLSNPLDKSRYLVPLYLSTPIIFGVLWSALRPALLAFSRARGRVVVSEWDALPPAANSAPRARLAWSGKALAAGGVMLLLLTLSVMDGVGTWRDSTNSALYRLPEPPQSAAILAAFDAHHVRTFYADDYLDCYRFAFESNERQICAILDSHGHPDSHSWVNRYPPYVAAVANDPHRAYLLPANAVEQAAFTNGELPSAGYVRIKVGRFAIYYYSGPSSAG